MLLLDIILGILTVVVPCALLAAYNIRSYNKQVRAAYARMGVSSWEEMVRPIGPSFAK